MQSEQDQTTYGRCYCGGVRFSIQAGARPIYAGYCHCLDCRRAHAAPIYQYVYVEKRCFQIMDGSRLLKWYTRAESARDRFKRFFCATCGSKVYNYLRTERDDQELELCGTFPSLFDSQKTATSSPWLPRRHVHCDESILNLTLLQDGLPRS